MTNEEWSPRALPYVDLAFLAISVCEAVSLFPDEVDLIWKGRRNACQFFYLISRYLCVASYVIFFIADAPEINMLKHGRFLEWQGLTHVLLNVNLFFVEGLFVLRTWALYGQNKAAGIVLAIFFALLWITTICTLAFSYGRLSAITYCYCTSLAVFYTIHTILITIRIIITRNDFKTDLVRLVHCQCLIYYGILFILSVAALPITIMNPSRVLYVARTLQLIFTTLACRMTLRLKRYNSQAPARIWWDNSSRNSERTVIFTTLNVQDTITSACSSTCPTCV